LLLLLLLLPLQSIERHQMEVPIASFSAAAQQLRVLQMDNVRLTAHVSRDKRYTVVLLCFVVL
jgi:hypothetical protein